MRGRSPTYRSAGSTSSRSFGPPTSAQVATIPVGKLPHGLWPSGDGSRIYVGLENADRLVAIDTATNAIVGEVPVGQAPQAVNYVPDAVPVGDGAQGLQQLGIAGQVAHLTLNARRDGHAVDEGAAPTSVSLFDQGLLQVLQASVSGLAAKTPYVLGLTAQADGSGPLEPLATFTTNPAGSAIVNAIGPIRQLVRGEGDVRRRYLVITGQGNDRMSVVQVQAR